MLYKSVHFQLKNGWDKMKKINYKYACRMLNLTLPTELELYHAEQREKNRKLIDAYNKGELVYKHHKSKGGEKK